MTINPKYSAQRRDPLLYWATLIYMVGFPNFLHFDSTGRAHLQSAANLTTVSNLLLMVGAAYIFGVLFLLRKSSVFPRKVHFDAGLWVSLFVLFLVSSVLSPSFHQTPYSATALPFAIYSLLAWLVAFFLLVSLYSRTPPEHATDLIVELAGRLSWISVAMVWIILPLMPGQIYTDGGESAATKPQLGGQFIGPSLLATLAVAAFFYSLLFVPRLLPRVAGCAVALLTLVLARTRIEQLSFLILLVIYALFYSGRFLVRTAVLTFGAAILALGVVFRGAIITYVSRGQSSQSLATLDDRTLVWAASLEAIRQRPLLGFGFVVGVKNAIRDHWSFVHWLPPHAHNEFLNTALAGGVLAVIPVVCIYARALWLGFRRSGNDKRILFLFLITILMGIRAVGGANISGYFTRVGALFLLAFLGIVGAGNKTPRRRVRLDIAGSRLEPEVGLLQGVLEEPATLVPSTARQRIH